MVIEVINDDYRMKNKITALFIVSSLFSVTTMAQTVQDKLHKQLKDPQTATNAAKADVYLHKQNEKNIIADSMQLSKPTTVTEKKKKAPKKKNSK
ncbi:MAG TPA: hypothetical protein VM888_03725 [Chitinophagaceae bacterium]|jgi:hypothetical protein|nr:hypothetical protein [Chitinophagaceae bacterium]